MSQEAPSLAESSMSLRTEGKKRRWSNSCEVMPSNTKTNSLVPFASQIRAKIREDSFRGENVPADNTKIQDNIFFIIKWKRTSRLLPCNRWEIAWRKVIHDKHLQESVERPATKSKSDAIIVEQIVNELSEQLRCLLAGEFLDRQPGADVVRKPLMNQGDGRGDTENQNQGQLCAALTTTAIELGLGSLNKTLHQIEDKIL